MVEIESSPKMVAAVLERTARTLDAVRPRLRRPLTLADKILLGHLKDPESAELRPGESQLQLHPDRVAFQDVLGQSAMLQFMQTRLDRVAVPTTIHCDHLIQARREGVADLRDSLEENREVYDFLGSAAARFGVGFWEPGAGIIHQVILENYAFPGALIIGTDSHTPNAGGLGACAVGVGGADAVEVIAGLPWELRYPKRIAVVLTGALDGWAAPKDVILWLAGQLGVAGGTNAVIEYIGPGTETISATGKATIANMGAELGATTSVFPYDARMATYLKATGRGDLVPIIERHRELLRSDPAVLADPAAHYDRVLELDLSKLEPHVVGPHSPDRARPLSALAAEVAESGNGFIDAISTALIGSCTNSSYEDMSRAADVAAQARAHGLSAAVPFLVTPGSERVRATLERDGQSAALAAIGGQVLANACGPCIGQWRRARAETAKPNTIVTSYNRNFPARNDGQPATMNFIASPEIVTALALAGRLSFDPRRDALTGADGKPFKLVPPKPAPEVPSAGFADSREHYVAPPEGGLAIPLKIDPESKRLQVLEPWPAWDGKDFLDMPVLVKTAGKTTTDQISPAGPWLALRGHLDRFSDNLLSGAMNAFTGDRGRGSNQLTGAEGEAFAKVARAYREAGLPWVVIGDANYGEGSSREHAALSPRLLGGVAVIARSFARIHETNLKKQGLLALTFSDPADYERIREDDRLSLLGLRQLTPGQPVICRLAHADGTFETLKLVHSYSHGQLAWFQAGSALNLLTLFQKSA
ncbi:aconitate hydratase [Pelagibius sp.]|uniref:aconitate hydratase n=1 Tax=Pelagibius sp. TaxID=1931238 RepID=UPI0026199900|nr:aconitate hydratase [Pelagibius sp.]